MYRYIAFSWNWKDPAKTAEARRLTRRLLSTPDNWQTVLDIPGLRVLHVREPAGACKAYVLPRHAGVVVGKLFDRHVDVGGVPVDPGFDERESNRLIESQGRRLVDRYWGHYVAFLLAPRGHKQYVLRDPTGGLPCYRVEVAGVGVTLSDIEDGVQLGLTSFSVDWSHVAAFFFQHTRLVTRSTGLKEVTQLLAGECAAVEYDGGTTRTSKSFYWDPVRVYEADLIENTDEARLALRDVIRYCVGAWASCYDSIVHELSGGLDSSIVADSLSRVGSPLEVVCLHYFTEMSEGDERPYARAMARSTGFELVESEVRVSERPLKSLLNPSRVVTPAMVGLLPASELMKQHLVAERHAGAVFTGQGGDQVFLETRGELIAAEYAHRHGMRSPLFRIVREANRLSHQSLWQVWKSVVRYGLFRRSFDPYSVYRDVPSVLGERARALLNPRAYTHPWIESAHDLPAAKMEHVLNVVDCQPFYQESCPSAEQIHPLISQPIIEQSLQVPAYVLAHGSRARGLFREAFATDLPAEITRRRSKGATTSYFTRLLMDNAAFLREFLLDGAMVSADMLDRSKLERLLSERELMLGEGQRSILCSLTAEHWMDSWADARLRTAA